MFDKRGIEVTNKVYFLTDPQIHEGYVLQFADSSYLYEVVGFADPDATAGLGVVEKVFARRTTVGSTP